MYAHLLRDRDAAGRKALDDFLWSDPAREQALIKALVADGGSDG